MMETDKIKAKFVYVIVYSINIWISVMFKGLVSLSAVDLVESETKIYPVPWSLSIYTLGVGGDRQ